MPYPPPSAEGVSPHPLMSVTWPVRRVTQVDKPQVDSQVPVEPQPPVPSRLKPFEVLW